MNNPLEDSGARRNRLKERREGDAAWLTANDRFKQAYGGWTWMGVLGAIFLHFALFAWFPQLQAADIGTVTDEIVSIDLPPEVKIPPPPEQIARPATPRVSADVNMDEDVTIAPTTFEDNPVENLPPPPEGARPSDVPSYIPRDVEPRMKNGAEISRVLQRLYPPMLREAGITGEVTLWVFVDENGRAAKSQVQKSSGYPAFDNAAQQVVEQMRFSPAMNRDKPVGVWVAQRIDWRITS
ncbi:MAG: energy transducer TonB [Gemmatimonadota bacterium]|nr:energy transducer TonB [Gemmatimonadota bacterium]